MWPGSIRTSSPGRWAYRRRAHALAGSPTGTNAAAGAPQLEREAVARAGPDGYERLSAMAIRPPRSLWTGVAVLGLAAVIVVGVATGGAQTSIVPPAAWHRSNLQSLALVPAAVLDLDQPRRVPSRYLEVRSLRSIPSRRPSVICYDDMPGSLESGSDAASSNTRAGLENPFRTSSRPPSNLKPRSTPRS